MSAHGRWLGHWPGSWFGGAEVTEPEPPVEPSVPPSGLGFPYRPRPRTGFDFQEADQQWLMAILAQMVAGRML